ncbi:hypothetical protein IX329_002027 [Fusobacterium necrophorum]|nr:hypothetical protein [Fusobacterium necrophorum]MBR8790607.1 hypothetical protein [Fusobacterium necrophorum]MBR8823087.1 hypothetical protein [Fusobacterium necrophorum]SDB34833.1 hypothetical protein SAMN02983009_01669 [Fusobacterium necrophorum]SQD09801.1 Uncharacterised protein [Fusobacterium necrophorum subsp. necrophorum]
MDIFIRDWEIVETEFSEQNNIEIVEKILKKISSFFVSLNLLTKKVKYYTINLAKKCIF